MSYYGRIFSWISISCVAFVYSCGQANPSQLELNRQLQLKLPEGIQVEYFEKKASDNLGNDAQLLVQTRFYARLTLVEDTFFSASNLDSIPQERQKDISFIKQAETKGKLVDLYGIATSRLVNEEWQTEFQYDTDPTPSLGKPRNSFGNRTVLRDSPEEQAFIIEVKRQIKEDRAFLVSMLKENKQYSGERRQDDVDGVRPFFLQFESFDQRSNKFIGKLEYPTLNNAVIEIQGDLSDDGLTFTTTKILRGENLSVGTVYNMYPVNRNYLQGRWEGKQPILFGAILFGPGSNVDQDGAVPIGGEISIQLN